MHLTASSLQAEFLAHFRLYLSIPAIAALVGYVSKSLAVLMIFRPLEFIGIRPWLGWQGVVPRRADKMATMAADLLLGRLLKPEELVARLDRGRMLRELEQPLLKASEDLAREIGERYMAGFWLLLPEFARRAIVRRLQQEIPDLAAQLWDELSRDVGRYFDARHLLVSTLVRDKVLLNDVLKRVGYKEFAFFRNAGLVFGFAIGLVQLVCWMLWHKPWLMPLFGAAVGLLSDWVELQMLFRPLRPVQVLGLKLQGLFIARQQEVARDYAAVIADRLLTPANMIEELLRGPFADRLVDLVQRQVKRATDEQLGPARPFVLLALGSGRYLEIRAFMVKRVLELLPEAAGQVERYAFDAMDIKATIVARMELLTPEEFEGMLRPPFKDNEIILVLAGAVLGFLVGELQMHLML